MKLRTLTISIWKDYTWEIFQGNIKNFRCYKHSVIDNAFAITKQDSKQRIIYLFDIYPHEKDIKLASKNKKFKEVCIFKLILTDGDRKRHIKTFKGDFIDALKCVQKHYQIYDENIDYKTYKKYIK